MVMIRVNKYEIIEDGGVQRLKVWYTYLGKEPMIGVPKITDAVFRTMAYSAQKIALEPGYNYWCVFNSNAHGVGSNIVSNFSMGVIFQLLTEDGSRVVYAEEIPFVITDYKRRSFSGKDTYAKPNFWLIGASMTGYMVRDMKPESFITSKYVITPVSHLALSLNRFLKSDYKKFLQSIPIKPNDTIGLFLGGVDMNVSVVRNAKLKGIRPQHLLNKILFKYLGVIKEIEQLYPKCKVIIIPTNATIPETHNVSNPTFIAGSQELRRELCDQYVNFFEQEVKSKNIEYFWDCLDVYLDVDRYCKKEFLIKDDHHIGDGTLFIEKLKKKIDENNLY
jgi:hypothetical protein